MDAVFFEKTRKIFGAFKTMSYICITYFHTLFSYYDTARFFSYFRAVFFWDNTNNSYICAILFILSNSFMFFRLGFPFYPSGFLLRKSSKNDPYFNDYFYLNKKIPHEISIKSLVRSFFCPKLLKIGKYFPYLCVVLIITFKFSIVVPHGLNLFRAVFSL